MFAKACEHGFEGMVSKREGGFYRCGRSRNWLKAKFDMTGVGALSPRRDQTGVLETPTRF